MMRRSRAQSRGLTPLEIAASIALVGSLLAVAVPAFVRNWSSSRLVEPIRGLTEIGNNAVAYANGRELADAFPKSAPLTPDTVPRGKPAIDAPEVWETPTWRALDFRPSPPGVAHSFSFGFDSKPGSEPAFVAHAHGDLDGDGTTSTFEVTGHADAQGARVTPGMYVESEVE